MQKENQLRSYYKNNLSSPNTCPSSPRSVSMRGIVAGVPNASLYSVQQPYGMTSEARAGFPAPRHSGRFLSGIWARTSAFTLIELLVVVLIIGILAAVALPQYQKAVMKSRYVNIRTTTKALADAEETYYLANGSYTQEIDELSVDFHQTPTRVYIGTNTTLYFFNDMYCAFSSDDEPGGARVSCADGKIAFIIHLQHATEAHSGDWRCNPVDSNDKIANWVCAQETGGKSSDGRYWYNK